MSEPEPSQRLQSLAKHVEGAKRVCGGGDGAGTVVVVSKSWRRRVTCEPVRAHVAGLSRWRAPRLPQCSFALLPHPHNTGASLNHGFSEISAAKGDCATVKR